jgi:phenylacetate-CoA ligase
MINRIRISDLLTGKQVWKFYKFYTGTQWYSMDQMKEFQLLKLRKLLDHCYRNVPYYRAIIEERQIDIRSFDSTDILFKFPLLTKEIIQANYDSFIPKNNKQIQGVKTSQTGGTTGNILFKRNDSQTRSSVWATYKRYEDWMGLKTSDKSLVLMGGHVRKGGVIRKTKDKLTSLLENSESIDIYNTSVKTKERVIELLSKSGFSQIRSYPQFLYSVAKMLEENGLQFEVKSISTTAEPVMPEHRLLFKKIFKAEVFDQYGSGEIGGIAYECDKHEGLHIAEERVILESNGSNELIITDLDNFTMPFIRYWNADQAIISNRKCSCGRQSGLIEKIMGRTCDYVTGINGQFLHWAYFWHLIFESKIARDRNLKKFQIVQNSYNKLLIRLVASTLSVMEEEFIISDIKTRLGEMDIRFSYESDIENTVTGKYKPVINRLLQTNQ